MKQSPVHPDEWKWLKGWLRSNLTVASLIYSFLIFAQVTPDLPVVSGQAATADVVQRDHLAATIPRPAAESPLPPETDLVLLTSRRPNPVAPEGWRRTVNGWEDASTWTTLGPSISQRIIAQQSREPEWVRNLFVTILGISPLMIALLQLTAVAAIVHVAQTRRRQTDQPAIVTMHP
jgi:hypothetical protein